MFITRDITAFKHTAPACTYTKYSHSLIHARISRYSASLPAPSDLSNQCHPGHIIFYALLWHFVASCFPRSALPLSLLSSLPFFRQKVVHGWSRIPCLTNPVCSNSSVYTHQRRLSSLFLKSGFDTDVYPPHHLGTQINPISVNYSQGWLRGVLNNMRDACYAGDGY